MLRSIFLVFMFAFSGCANLTSSSVLSVDFSEVEDSSFLTFQPAGPPRFDTISVTAGPGADLQEVRVANGRLLFNSRSNRGNALAFRPRLSPSGTTALLYYWRGSFAENGVAGLNEGPLLSVRLEVPQPPRAPRTILSLNMRSELRDGERVLRVFSPSGNEIGLLGIRRSHGVLLAINLEEEVYTLSGGNFGDINSGPIELNSSIPNGVVPRIVFTSFAPGSSILEYSFETFNVVALAPRPS